MSYLRGDLLRVSNFHPFLTGADRRVDRKQVEYIDLFGYLCIIRTIIEGLFRKKEQ